MIERALDDELELSSNKVEGACMPGPPRHLGGV